MSNNRLFNGVHRKKLFEKSFLPPRWKRLENLFFQKRLSKHAQRSLPPQGLRVLHLLVNLEMGGAERLLVDALPLFPRDKYCMKVLGLGKDGTVGELLRSKGISASALGGSKSDPSFVLRLVKYLTKNKPHILHTHLFMPGVLGRLIGKAVGIEIIISHEHFQNAEIYHALLAIEKRTWRFADASVFISKKIKEERSVCIPDSVKKFVIYNGIDATEIERGERRKGRQILGGRYEDVIVGWVGRVDEHEKNLTALLKAMKKVSSSHKNIKVVLIGEGKDIDKLKTATKQMGLDSTVAWLGAREDARSLYAGMDIFVLPSRFEGMPLVLLEAMSAGLPIVASQVGGIPEVVVDGETGFLVECDDYEALAERISLLANDTALRKKMGEKGKERFDKNFRIERFVEKLDNLYTGLWTGDLSCVESQE